MQSSLPHSSEELSVLSSSREFDEAQGHKAMERTCPKQSLSPTSSTNHVTDSNEVPLASKSEKMTPKETSSGASDDQGNLQGKAEEVTALTVASEAIDSKVLTVASEVNGSKASVIDNDPPFKLEEESKEAKMEEKPQRVSASDSQKADDRCGQEAKMEEESCKASSTSQCRGESPKQANRDSLKRKRETNPTRKNQKRLAVAETELQTETQDANDSVRQEKKQSQALREEVKRLQGNVAWLQETTLRQDRELQSCKDTIFRLRPSAQVPDSEIKSHYESLCANISDWVSSQLRDFEERTSTSVAAISSGGRSRWEMLLKRVPQVDEYLVGSVIHDRLRQEFFGSHVVYLGIPQDVAKLLQEWQESMALVEPRKGKELMVLRCFIS